MDFSDFINQWQNAGSSGAAGGAQGATDPGGWQAATQIVDTPWAARWANMKNDPNTPFALKALAGAFATPHQLQLPPIQNGSQQPNMLAPVQVSNGQRGALGQGQLGLTGNGFGL